MDLLFCDVCNESVPQKDLDEGLAKRRRGRVVCATCEGAMSHGESSQAMGNQPARPAGTAEAGSTQTVGQKPGTLEAGESAASPGAIQRIEKGQGGRNSAGGNGAGVAALALAAVGLTAAVGGVAFLNDRLESEVSDREAALLEIRAASEAGTVQLERGLKVELEQLSSEIVHLREGLATEREAIATGSREERARTESLRADLSALTERLVSVEAFRDELDRIDLEVQKVGRFTADLHEQQLRLTQRLEELRSDIGNVREIASVDMGALLGKPDDAAAMEAEPDRPAWLDFIGDLKSQSASVRWQAVQSIGQSGDPASAEYLAPMLKDPDIFVRMAAARNLGDIAAPIGIPALIDALTDPEESVRESAVVSLRAVSGKDYRFAPGAKESERAKAVKRWRDWWDTAQSELLGAGGD